ncbi:metallophosphoesterase [Microlunatus elymi]|uniref:metallophosphoesterase n=1 Tax=Microlunatus elymi TaxID=2596828 RepID=UPI00143DFBCE|nr:metallophosphoesterase [Microlunatus elymi]
MTAEASNHTARSAATVAGADRDVDAEPLFRFGLLADVQYADDDPRPQIDRYYRYSLGKLAEAITEFNRHELAFVVHLGDLVDHDLENLPPVLNLLRQSTAPVRQVLGNHDFLSRTGPNGVSAEADVFSAFGLERPYYAFDVAGWRFLVLNTNEVGVIAAEPQTERWLQGRQLLDRLAAEKRPNANAWNGTIGPEQTGWLEDQIEDAGTHGLRAAILAHHPVFPDHGDNLLDDHRMRERLPDFPALKVWFNGHQHQGGYGEHGGVNYLTLCGMVQTRRNAYAIAEVYHDRIEIIGFDREPTRTLKINS